TDELGRNDTFTYDPQGNIATHVTRDGVLQQFEYDSRNDQLLRATQTQQSNGTNILSTQHIVSKSYDSSGNLLRTWMGRNDLAFNRTVTTSQGTTGANLTDENHLTAWLTNAPGTGWAYVDLGAPQSIAHVRLYWNGAYAKGYDIQVSSDALSWNRVGGETNNTSAGWKDYDVSGTSSTGRYV